MNKPWLLLICISCCIEISAQSNIYFFVKPFDTHIKVDDNSMMQNRDTILSEGEHVITFSKNNYLPVTDKVTVKQRTALMVRKRLQPTPEYSAYMQKCKGNSIKRNVISYLPLAAGGILFYKFMKNYHDLKMESDIYYDKMAAAKETIETSHDGLLNYIAIRDYKSNTGFYYAKANEMVVEKNKAVAFAMAGIASTIVLKFLTPALIKNPEFDNKSVSWTGIGYSEGMIQTSFTIKL
jgi:hypothetical protein